MYKKFIKYDPSTGKQYCGDINFSDVKNFTLEVITEKILDNTWYNTNLIVARDFPENANLEIGKKYQMNYCFNIMPGGAWSADMGLCYLIYREGNDDVIISGWPLNQLMWSAFQDCLGANPCMHFSQTSWGAYFAGSKVVTAQDVGGVGKVRLRFDIHHGYSQWRIYNDMRYSFIEFINIEN